jgi:hypothetical protein
LRRKISHPKKYCSRLAHQPGYIGSRKAAGAAILHIVAAESWPEKKSTSLIKKTRIQVFWFSGTIMLLDSM